MTFFHKASGVRLLELDQRTQAWHDWRNGVDLPDKMPRVTGTMAAIIAGDSVRGITPYQLWLEMTGKRKAPEPSEYLLKLFAHGQRMEPFARRAYTELTGNPVRDVCVQHELHPWAGASLDGLTPSADIILEIKCPISQRIHNLAKANQVPSYYRPQVQWQLLNTTCAKELHYYSYFPNDEDGITEALVVVKRDEVYAQWLLGQAVMFRSCLIDNRPPATDDWLLAAKQYRVAKVDADEVESRVKAAQAALLILMPTDRDTHEGGGVRVTRYASGIEVDYLAVFTSLGVSEEVAKKAIEDSREPGPVNVQKAIELLQLDQAKITEAELEQKKVKESQLRQAGKLKSRVTLTNDFKEEDSGRDLVAIAAQKVEQVTADAEPEPLNEWNW